MGSKSYILDVDRFDKDLYKNTITSVVNYILDESILYYIGDPNKTYNVHVAIRKHEKGRTRIDCLNQDISEHATKSFCFSLYDDRKNFEVLDLTKLKLTLESIQSTVVYVGDKAQQYSYNPEYESKEAYIGLRLLWNQSGDLELVTDVKAHHHNQNNGLKRIIEQETKALAEIIEKLNLPILMDSYTISGYNPSAVYASQVLTTNTNFDEAVKKGLYGEFEQNGPIESHPKDKVIGWFNELKSDSAAKKIHERLKDYIKKILGDTDRSSLERMQQWTFDELSELVEK